MTPALNALLPGLLVVLTTLVVIVQIAVKRSHAVACVLTCVGLAASFCTLAAASSAVPQQITPLIAIDRFAVFFQGATIAAGFAVAVFAFPYLRGCNENREEFYVLLLLGILGSLVLVSSTHFVSLFLGLELLTVSLIVMIGYLQSSTQSLEGGVKYLILATASSAFMLFGMALIYFESGSMAFGDIAASVRDNPVAGSPLLLIGGALFLVGAGYKLALVPFHMWTPDIYEGAPAPVTAFVATVPKGAMIALLLRFFLEAGMYHVPSLVVTVGVLAVASMFIGNFLALLQDNVKRLLAYSSISHMGYMLVAFVAGGAAAVQAIGYYVAAYYVTLLAAVGVISLLTLEGSEPMDLEDYRGLFWERPGIAATLAASMLSLAGIPLTAGFVGKFLVLTAGVGSALWTLVVILVVNSAIGLYYYLRVTVILFSRRPTEAAGHTPALSPAGGIMLAALAIALVFLGVYPSPLLWILRQVGMTLQ